MEAQVQARLHAELTARSDKPLDWLKAGPGKDAADNPGWTNPGKPHLLPPTHHYWRTFPACS